MKKILILIIGVVLMAQLILAAQSSLGIFKQGEPIELIQTCSNCTYSNITNVKYPNSTIAINEVTMTKMGTVYNYTFVNSNALGTYIVNGLSDVDGIETVWAYTFEVTPSGASPISSGQSQVILAAMAVIFIISVLFFVIGFRIQNTAGKAIFITFGAIMLLVLILYTLLVLNESVAMSPTLVEGFETFYFVMRIGGLIAFIGLMVVIFLFFLRAWKIKRGLLDG